MSVIERYANFLDREGEKVVRFIDNEMKYGSGFAHNCAPKIYFRNIAVYFISVFFTIIFTIIVR